MSEEELQELIERLRMLARGVIANGHEEVTIGKFVIGEDLPTGNLAVDVIDNLMKRNAHSRLKPSTVGRRCFMMVGRNNEVSIKLKDRHLLKDLSYQMILDELANV
jgi:hypothetical protein